MRARLPRPVALGLAVAAVAALARAQPEGIVLHEPVPGARDDEIALVGRPGGGDGASSLLYDGALLDAPAADAPPDPTQEVPMSAEPGDGVAAEAPGRRSPTFRPDRQTALEGRLGYYASFNPTVAPFKRVTAYDALAIEDGVPVLTVADPALAPYPVVGTDAPADRPRDRFWGDVLLDFRAGVRVPLPLPGAGARLLWARGEPEVDVAFERDAAGNAFARLDGSPPPGPVRLTFLADVPRAHFAAPIPDAPADALAAEIPSPLPPGLAAAARTFAGELGLGASPSLREALETLVAHFRAFEESDEPPADTGDIYLDLARGGRGICRHRAYAFVPTALALGIPARFVMNEAHSWVEVKLPGTGWLRIDLGGAAEGLDARGAAGRVLHRPPMDDPLPRPEAYERSYSRLAGDVSGLPAAPPGPRGADAAGGARAGTSPGVDADAARWGGRRRTRVRLSIEASDYAVRRGRPLELRGRTVGPDGAGLPGLRVEARLRGAGGVVELGATVTGPDGRYRGVFEVPPDLDTGDYALVLRFPGDARHAPAEVR